MPRDFVDALIEYVDGETRKVTYGFSSGNKLVLGGGGGAGGGSGMPWGGLVGQLCQKYVTYDTTEAAVISAFPQIMPISGSLVDNLNHIRFHQIPITWFETSPTEPASMYVNVASGLWYYGSGIYLDYNGGVSPEFNNPSVFPRLDLLYITNLGVLCIEEGVEDSSPEIPNIPSGVLPLSAIWIEPTASGISWEPDKATMSGWIYKDMRPFLDYGTGGAGGALNFIDLLDVPHSYVGQAHKFPRVRADEMGLEFATCSGGGVGGAFTDLTDVPVSYVGQANKLVKVKATEDGLEFNTNLPNHDHTGDAGDGGKIDHGTALNGLNDDDHSVVYPNKTTAQTITGNFWTFNNKIEVAKNTDITCHLGRAAVGWYNADTDIAAFAHIDHMTVTNYALMQDHYGNTYINAAYNTMVTIRINDSIQMYVRTGAVSIGTAIDDQRLCVGGNIHVTSAGGTSLGYIYSDTNNFGLLNNTGSWALYIPNNTTNVMLPGRIYAAYNTDTTSYFGRAAVGFAAWSDCATFAHLDFNTGANYALMQDNNGDTHINVPANHVIFMRANNSTILVTLYSNGSIMDIACRVIGTTAVGCRVIRTTDQTIPNNTVTAIIFDTELYDTDLCWGAAYPTRLYAKHDGYYMAGGNVVFKAPAGTPASVRAILIYLNNSQYLARNEFAMNEGTSVGNNVVTGMFYMAANDYIEIKVYQDTGGNLDIIGASSTYQQRAHGWLTRIT